MLSLIEDIQEYLPRQIGTSPTSTATPLGGTPTAQPKPPPSATKDSPTYPDTRLPSSALSQPASPLLGDRQSFIGSSALATVLKQETARFTRLLNVIHSSLRSLLQSIHGQVLLSEEIEETYKSLLQNQVPLEWQVNNTISTRVKTSGCYKLFKLKVVKLKMVLSRICSEQYFFVHFRKLHGSLNMHDFMFLRQKTIGSLNFTTNTDTSTNILEALRVVG